MIKPMLLEFLIFILFATSKVCSASIDLDSKDDINQGKLNIVPNFECRILLEKNYTRLNSINR